jgi:hypothetical protein
MLTHDLPAQAEPTRAVPSRLDQLEAVSFALNSLKNAAEDTDAAVREFLAALESASNEVPDPAPLQLATQQLRQSLQALRDAGLDKPGLLITLMTRLLEQFVLEPATCNEAAAATLARASAALTHALRWVLDGQAFSVQPLFAPYRDLSALLGQPQVHPADLWPMPWRWLSIEVTPAFTRSNTPLDYDIALRNQMDQAVLDLVKAGTAQASQLSQASQAAQSLSEICLGLACAQIEKAAPQGKEISKPAVFWQIAGAFFQALAHESLALDVYVKRTASRVLRQYTLLSRGDVSTAQALAHDLLYFCAQASEVDKSKTPLLAGVLQAYGLDAASAADLASHERSVEQDSDYAPVGKDFLGDLEFPQLPEAQAPIAPEPSLAPPAVIALPENDIDDEQVRVIGTLRIGIPEYNIYLNEADEWSRRLQTELSEWVLELHQPLPATTVVLAQDIAQSSDQVGFLALSELAKALALALGGFAKGVSAEPAHARIFVAAAEAVRHLLHQFAAGFLKQSEPELILALERIAQTALTSLQETDERPNDQTDLQALLFAQGQGSDHEPDVAHVAQLTHLEDAIAALTLQLEGMQAQLRTLKAQAPVSVSAPP